MNKILENLLHVLCNGRCACWRTFALNFSHEDKLGAWLGIGNIHGGEILKSCKKNLQEVYTSLPCNSVGIHFLSVWKHPNSVLLAPNTAESQDSCFVTIPCFGMGFQASRDLDLKLFTTLTQRACRCHVTLSRWGSGGCVVTSLYWAFYLCFRVQYCGILRNYLELSKIKNKRFVTIQWPLKWIC